MKSKSVIKSNNENKVVEDIGVRQQLTELRLLETQEALKLLQSQHSDLGKEFRLLQEKNVKMTKCAMDTAWRYCPRHSNDFQSMPLEDMFLNETETSIGQYSVVDIMGEGQFSVVKRCRKSDKTLVAVKQIKKGQIKNIEEVVRVEHEIRALKMLSPHPNIVSYIESVHGLQNLYIVTELLPMDLFEFIDTYHDKLDENAMGVIVRELLHGLAHLAANHVAHMDIKPENVLVGFKGNELMVKLCDFGLSSLMTAASSILTEFCGSPGFFAPEVYMQKRFCGYKADIFSLGCIALEMMVPQVFFKEVWVSVYDFLKKGEVTAFARAMKEAVDYSHAEIKKRYSKPICEFMNRMLSMNPATRYSVQDLYPPVISEYVPLPGTVTAPLRTNPNTSGNSGGVSTAIMHWLNSASHACCVEKTRGFLIKRSSMIQTAASPARTSFIVPIQATRSPPTPKLLKSPATANLLPNTSVNHNSNTSPGSRPVTPLLSPCSSPTPNSPVGVPSECSSPVASPVTISAQVFKPTPGKPDKNTANFPFPAVNSPNGVPTAGDGDWLPKTSPIAHIPVLKSNRIEEFVNGSDETAGFHRRNAASNVLLNVPLQEVSVSVDGGTAVEAAAKVAANAPVSPTNKVVSLKDNSGANVNGKLTPPKHGAHTAASSKHYAAPLKLHRKVAAVIMNSDKEAVSSGKEVAVVKGSTVESNKLALAESFPYTSTIL